MPPPTCPGERLSSYCGPMGDRDIVAVVAGDPAGLAVAYDSYAVSLHAYCRALLADPAEAADAVQYTFVIAAARLGSLRGRGGLRPWLYAVARNECYGRLREGASPADLHEAAGMTGLDVGVGTPDVREELRSLVLDAIGAMNPGDREIIELNLRHDLDGADLAEVLGVPADQAHALVWRARDHLERSLGALLVARDGRRQCAELDAILDSWDGRLAVVRSKRASKHIAGCETCGARKLLPLSPAMLLSVLPLVTLPAGLREKIMWLVSDATAGTASYRRRVAARAEPFSQSGFPVQIAPADQGAQSHRAGDGDGVGDWDGDDDGLGRPRRRHRLRSWALVLSAVILLGGGATAAYRFLDGTGPGAAAKDSSAAAAPLTVPPVLSASGPASARSGPRSAARAKVVPRGSHTSSLSPAVSRAVSPPTASSPTASPTHPVISGTLNEAPATIALTQAGGPYSATFTLTAVGVPESFSVVVPASESYLSVSPASGILSAGHSQTITVTLTPSPGSRTPYTSTVTVNHGGMTVTVLYV